MISLYKASKKYGEKSVLSSLDIDFAEGETTCILGPSGCGKSTLLKIVSGVITPDSGSVRIDAGAKKSFIFQENRLLPWLDCLGNITYTGVTADRAAEYMEKVKLKGEKKKFPGQLSGGMQRRLCIARALAYGGECFFFDEPLQGLDVSTNDSMISLIKEETKGKTVLLITHSISDAAAFADRVIIAHGIPFELLCDINAKVLEDKEELEKLINEH